MQHFALPGDFFTPDFGYVTERCRPCVVQDQLNEWTLDIRKEERYKNVWAACGDFHAIAYDKPTMEVRSLRDLAEQQTETLTEMFESTSEPMYSSKECPLEPEVKYWMPMMLDENASVEDCDGEECDGDCEEDCEEDADGEDADGEDADGEDYDGDTYVEDYEEDSDGEDYEEDYDIEEGKEGDEKHEKENEEEEEEEEEDDKRGDEQMVDEQEIDEKKIEQKVEELKIDKQKIDALEMLKPPEEMPGVDD